ncbi:MAG TPA: hypothetical protein VN634_20750 [Candidatus Limnocylindrales bacterium]|nr:hypothetical protein [Candidatus Limnocylindrales bacterium]
MMTPANHTPCYVMCIANGDYPASLEVRKVYRCVPDAEANEHGLFRVIDDSGEDYLYPEDLFEPITLSAAAAKLFEKH